MSSIIKIQLINSKLIIKIIVFYVIKIKLLEKNIREKSVKKANKRKGESFKIIEFIRLILGNVLKKLEVNLKASITLGLKEPYYTALLYGGLNSTLGCLNVVFNNIFKKYFSQISINPNFVREIFEVELNLLLKIRNFDLIKAFIVFLINYIKLKGKGEKLWNIQ
ncbi:Protein of unknown function [Caloramator fervidus]|uniref:DUF2953 domain-containing protein n=2 Tax=Caloramator fervidus TaxID=29344 RepID=A0A1H5UJ35_9CLOT|nr:Protein of unknown function [Caloramator fervidus]